MASRGAQLGMGYWYRQCDVVMVAIPHTLNVSTIPLRASIKRTHIVFSSNQSFLFTIWKFSQTKILKIYVLRNINT